MDPSGDVTVKSFAVSETDKIEAAKAMIAGLVIVECRLYRIG